MSAGTRILNAAMRSKIMSAEQASALIQSGMNVGMSGFTGAGYPKAVPVALAKQIMDASFRGEKFRVSIWTGASTAPELDGALAMVDGVELRLPYQSDPTCRKKINAGEMEYLDIHLSHVGAFVRQGFLGKLDVAAGRGSGADSRVGCRLDAAGKHRHPAVGCEQIEAVAQQAHDDGADQSAQHRGL